MSTNTKTKARYKKKQPDGLTPISARKINFLQGVSAEDIQLLGAALALGLAAGAERAKGRTQGETHTRTGWVLAWTALEAMDAAIDRKRIFETRDDAMKFHDSLPQTEGLKIWQPFRVTVTASEE